MSRRAVAAPGQSYLEANRGRVIAVENDVLDIKRRIEQQWPNLEVVYDQVDDKWVVVQHWTNDKGEPCESLALMADELDERLINRLHEADPESPHYVDPLDAVDKYNAEIERDREREFEDKIGDAGERLIHAFKKDGIDHHDNIEGGPKKVKRNQAARKAINRGSGGNKKRSL